MSEVGGDGMTDLILPGLVAENSLNYEFLLKKLNDPPTGTNSQWQSPNSGHIIEIDGKSVSKIQHRPNILSPTNGNSITETTKLKLDDGNFSPQKSLYENGFDTPKITFARAKLTEDKMGDTSRLIFTNRSIDKSFNEDLSPDTTHKRWKFPENEYVRDAADEKLSGNDSSLLDCSELKSLKSRSESKVNQSQVIAVEDYEYFLKEAETQQPKRKSRFSQNSGYSKGNDKNEDQSTDAFDSTSNKESRKRPSMCSDK